MDLGPKRDRQPPLNNGTLAQSAPTITINSTSVPGSSASLANSKIHLYKIACSVFDGDKSIKSAVAGLADKDHISAWLNEPSPSLAGGGKLVAGLRLVCLTQKDSIQWPFNKPTMEAIHHTMGLPSTHPYLTMAKSGACGTYLEMPTKPGEAFGKPSKTHTLSKRTSSISTTVG